MGNGMRRGFTLVELMTALAISAVLLLGVVSALVGLAREKAVREVIAIAQEEARFGLGILGREIRSASLGAPSGVVWAADSAGNRISRPTVQIYEDVAGGGVLEAKPNTDALLVVQALGAPRAAAVGDHLSSANPLKVTDSAGFATGMRVVFGEYADAGFATITDIDADDDELTLKPTADSTSTANLYPGAGAKLSSGSLVRPAQVRLYYVNARDELVRVELLRPVPPGTAAEIVAREVLATAFENLQIECSLDQNGPLTACGAGVASPDPLAVEATAALGAARARVTVAEAPRLRVLRLNAVVHGRNPVRDGRGDAPIALDGHALAPAGAGAGDEWVRRAYQLELAVRNTSLEAL